ncbi:hypothetical protein Arno162_44 [Pectobacterium phage Arno162]|uniref:Uncharacterized protein n=1 Tax=Pectobacterium phage Arno162 TaxID=2500577 RepID=A0A678ZJP2_9CAUD|nr:hypothetical protein Arno162_44 [Pectobacterium phage Arno162]
MTIKVYQRYRPIDECSYLYLYKMENGVQYGFSSYVKHNLTDMVDICKELSSNTHSYSPDSALDMLNDLDGRPFEEVYTLVGEV